MRREQNRISTGHASRRVGGILLAAQDGSTEQDVAKVEFGETTQEARGVQ